MKNKQIEACQSAWGNKLMSRVLIPLVDAMIKRLYKNNLGF